MKNRLALFGVPRLLLGAIAIVVISSLAACGEGASGDVDLAPETWAWAAAREDIGFRDLLVGSGPCRGCMQMESRVRLGEESGPGLLIESGEFDDVVVDSRGNFWIGGPGQILVFDSNGTFLRTVGTRGQGPMEFQYARPVYTDGQGRVHVTDGGNRRETIISPDFELADERRLAGAIHEEAPLDDGKRYAVQMLVADSVDHIGYPLHITEGSEIVHSFGASVGEDAEILSGLTAQRVLTVDPKGHIYSLKPYDYSVEVWTESGLRITGLRGPQLNEKHPEGGRWTVDNPPANRIFDAYVDEDALLWVVSWQLRANWRDAMQEQVAPDGTIALLPKEDDWTHLFRSRIDIIDLSAGTLVGQQYFDPLLIRFLADGSLLQAGYYETGDVYLEVWDVSSTPARKGGN